MNKIYQLQLTLTLLDDCVMSAHGGSAAEHSCLDYIPGSTLMGIAAAHCYRDPLLPRATIIELFQSGLLRFGNGYYLSTEGEPVEPTPLSLYYAKAADAPAENGYLLGSRLIDLADPPDPPELDPAQQYKCLDSNTVEPKTGRYCTPKFSMEQKSAINPATGTAADAMLFHYQYLRAGERFRATLRFAGTEEQWQTHQPILQTLAQHLHGEHRIGKGRLSQYGSVGIQADSWQRLPEDTDVTPVSRATLRLLSDLAAFDQWQQPTFTPTPQTLGLPTGQFIPEKSFIATRRYSPYNSYYRSRERERQVISRGSVLTFQFDNPHPTMGALRSQLRMGLGNYRRDGLGEATLDRLPLVNWQGGAIVETPALTLQRPGGDAQTNQQIMNWLQQRAAHSGQQNHDAILTDLQTLYIRIKAYNAQEETAEFGPGRSQWARVMQLCKEANSREILGTNIKSTIQEGDAHWKWSAPDLTGQSLSFREWLLNLVANEQYNLTDLALIAKKAKEANIRGVNK